jgi:hypothetical protein
MKDEETLRDVEADGMRREWREMCEGIPLLHFALECRRMT